MFHNNFALWRGGSCRHLDQQHPKKYNDSDTNECQNHCIGAHLSMLNAENSQVAPMVRVPQEVDSRLLAHRAAVKDSTAQ